MIRLTHLPLAIALILGAGATLKGQEAPRPDTPAEKTAAAGIELVVSPAAAPVPTLRYHLLPPARSLVPGNAVPIYLRLVHEQNDEWKHELGKASDLLEPEFDKMPLDEAEEVVDRFSHVLEQISAAGRRRDADWQYVMELGDPLDIRLGDSQFMRAYMRLEAVRIRYAMRKGNLKDALDGIVDAMALGQHTARAPFIVTQLIGIAISNVTLDQVEIFVAQPGAPNLYWALAALPRPLISFARGFGAETDIIELKFPQLKDLTRPRSEAEWRELVQAMRQWAVVIENTESKGKPENLKRIAEPATPAQLTRARERLVREGGLGQEQVAAMVDAEVEVRFTVALFHRLCDMWVCWFDLSYPQSLPGYEDRSRAETEEGRREELYPLVSALVPIQANLLAVQCRSDRKVARLMVIEALRMHAAATGKLPDKLADVTVVPVPMDPATGTSFIYSREGDAAKLDLAPAVPDQREDMRMPITLRLRAK